ncbi:unnamed protein product, partial [marine sediment metagenome]
MGENRMAMFQPGSPTRISLIARIHSVTTICVIPEICVPVVSWKLSIPNRVRLQWMPVFWIMPV